MATLDKKATKEAIIEKARSSDNMSINIEKFNETVNTPKDILDACKFCRMEPIYKN